MAESGSSGDNDVTKVGSLVSSMEDELKNPSRYMQPGNCIFKTPIILSRHNKDAFLPNFIAIGPMHRGRENLVAAEKIKTEYLQDLLSRVSTSWELSEEAKQLERQNILTDWVNAVKSIEKEASACYAGHDFAAELGDEFVKIMVRDSCFILELFRKHLGEVNRKADDPIFSMSCTLQFLYHDLILMENQVPWLVLQTLFDKTKLPSGTESLIVLSLLFFASMFTFYPPDPEKIERLSAQITIKHILDLLRLSLVLPSKEIKYSYLSGWQPVPSITRLQQAGVKLVKVAPDSILDIKFRGGSLQIPSLLLQETTETILRNLIAYEQCLPHCQPICTCYAKLLDNLIESANDINILFKKKIYDKYLLSPEDATPFFNKLSNDTFAKEFYYSGLCNDLNWHCNRWWPRIRAYYLETFTKPWAVVAQIYAGIMLILTFWQTYIKKG